MDIWRYYAVTHARHGIMNPLSAARLVEVGEILRLDTATRVLDIACGQAEMLMLWHERFGITGVGVDASPYHLGEACERKVARVPDANLDLRLGEGQSFETDERFDVAVCLGASWIWNGFEGTLRALTGFSKPGGIVVSGEPYWMDDPTPEYLAHEEVQHVPAGLQHLVGVRQVRPVGPAQVRRDAAAALQHQVERSLPVQVRGGPAHVGGDHPGQILEVDALRLFQLVSQSRQVEGPAEAVGQRVVLGRQRRGLLPGAAGALEHGHASAELQVER